MPNGKVYVGITKNSAAKRWQNGKGYSTQTVMSRAIKKYGWDAIEHRVLAFGLSEDEAKAAETAIIKAMAATTRRGGYNCTAGGEGPNDETRKRMGECRRGIKPPPFTDEHKRKLKLHHAGGHAEVRVLCVDTGTEYRSINDAARATGINKKQISGCCHRIPNYNTAGGLRWAFADLG